MNPQGVETHTVHIDGVILELRTPATLVPGVLRSLHGKTPLDADVDALTVPSSPLWLAVCVKALRWYRVKISPRLGQRCVFDPSCSRYAELSFRHYGFFKGGLMIVRRLRRCRPGAGGTDLP